MDDDTENPAKLLATSLQSGRVDVLRTLLSELAQSNAYHDVINGLSTANGTLLHYAVKLSDVDAVRTLLSCGANPCVRNSDGYTPFQLSDGKPKIRQTFEQELLQSIAGSKLSRTCQLLSCGVPTSTIDSPVTRNTPLHWAASYGSVDIVKILCEGGADPNSLNANQESPLHDAVIRGDVPIIKTLLEYGADLRQKNIADKDCFTLANDKGRAEVVQFLNAYEIGETTVNASPQKRDRSPSLSSITSAQNQSNLLGDGMTNGVSGFPSPSKIGSHFTFPDSKPPTLTWRDWLWPYAKKIAVANDGDRFLIHDRNIVLKVTCDTVTERQIVTDVWANYGSALKKAGFDVTEYVSLNKDNNAMHDESSPKTIYVSFCDKMVCNKPESYNLQVLETGVKVCTWSVCGLHHAFASLSKLLYSSLSDKTNAISCLSIRDYTSVAYRCLSLNATPSRCLNVETVIKLIAKAATSLRVNTLILHFDTLICDDSGTVVLPYSAAEIDKLREGCSRYGACLAPSFDLVSSPSNQNKNILASVVEILRLFPKAALVQIGPTLCDIFFDNPTPEPQDNKSLVSTEAKSADATVNGMLNGVENGTHSYSTYQSRKKTATVVSPSAKTGLSVIHQFVPLILTRFRSFGSGNLSGQKAAVTESFWKVPNYRCDELPPFCAAVMSCNPMSVNPSGSAATHESPIEETEMLLTSYCESILSPLVLAFEVSNPSYFSLSPETIVKELLSAKRLLPALEPSVIIVGNSRFTTPQAKNGSTKGSIAFKQVDNRLPFHTLSLACTTALLGAAWNQEVDCLPLAQHLSRLIAISWHDEPKLESLFHVVLQVGFIEQQFDKLVTGAKNVSTRESVLFQLLVSPDDVALDNTRPWMFKKAKIELTRCLTSLHELKSQIPYDFDIAVTLVEAQLTAELLLVSAKLGMALCSMGTKPPPPGTRHTPATEPLSPTPSNTSFAVGFNVINVGVSNLALSTRTDIANKILNLRKTFQHSWLSRHQPSSLTNALGFFDRILAKLLPPGIRNEVNYDNLDDN